MAVLTDDQKEMAIQLAAEGKTLKQIRAAIGVEQRAFWTYRCEDIPFEQKFSRARSEGLEELADDLVTVADEYHDVQRGRLKSENVRWLLSKRKAHIYGDRIDLNVNQTVDIGGALRDARARAIPMRDPDTAIDAQVIEQTKSLPSGATDSESVVSETIDAEYVEVPDIFS